MTENTTPSTDTTRSTIGFIGSGNIGSQLARLAVARGYHVIMSNSRGPETLRGLVDELGDAARAGSVEDAARLGDVVVVTIPQKDIDSVPVEPLAGKLVIDTCNYYPQRDGRIADLEDETSTTSEMLQRHLPDSSVVKAFNTIHFAQLTTGGTPAGTPGRRALPIAGDAPDAKQAVVDLLDEFGFDAVDAGALAEGWRFQRDTPAYGTVLDADGLRGALGQAKRYAEM
ncbi:putative dinucleotide-binding enzyme [Arthrobacter sp. PL16]|uniref:NADPH-dependent F420 reductase n=1 Tax=Arthrobacter sp. PL16 TaxID=3071720 RepID=UPI002E004C70|nr:putative dinucleotide-binding enzyme [Arthrobacter sp. PL16]